MTHRYPILTIATCLFFLISEVLPKKGFLTGDDISLLDTTAIQKHLKGVYDRSQKYFEQKQKRIKRIEENLVYYKRPYTFSMQRNMRYDICFFYTYAAKPPHLTGSLDNIVIVFPLNVTNLLRKHPLILLNKKQLNRKSVSELFLLPFRNHSKQGRPREWKIFGVRTKRRKSEVVELFFSNEIRSAITEWYREHHLQSAAFISIGKSGKGISNIEYTLHNNDP